MIFCKGLRSNVAVITQRSTTFRLELIHCHAVQPPATRDSEEGVSGELGCNTIMASIRRNEARNRTATPRDDDFFACFNPDHQGAQTVSGLRIADFVVCGACHDFLPEYYSARWIVSHLLDSLN